jgi:RimJ/RimL family protein N-acetyltransferase
MPDQTNPDEPLTGELVELRALREDDLWQLVEWWSLQELAAMQVSGPTHPRPSAALSEMFRAWSQNSGTDVGLSVVTRDAGQLAGHVGLHGAGVKDRCATLAILIGPPYQRRGLGSDAIRILLRYGFDELGLHRIQLSVNGYNTAAIAAYAKAGFVEEGRRRDAVFRHGAWHDDVQMGILAREWTDR